MYYRIKTCEFFAKSNPWGGISSHGSVLSIRLPVCLSVWHTCVQYGSRTLPGNLTFDLDWGRGYDSCLPIFAGLIKVKWEGSAAVGWHTFDPVSVIVCHPWSRWLGWVPGVIKNVWSCIWGRGDPDPRSRPGIRGPAIPWPAVSNTDPLGITESAARFWDGVCHAGPESRRTRAHLTYYFVQFTTFHPRGQHCATSHSLKYYNNTPRYYY